MESDESRMDTIEILKDLARRCYDCQDREPGFRQGKKAGVNYCTMLWFLDDVQNRKEGHIVCPFTDHSFMVHDEGLVHPGCKYKKQEAAD